MIMKCHNMACTDAGDGGRYSSSSRFRTPSDRGEHDAGDSKRVHHCHDEGTTNAKAVVLDSRGKVIVKFSQPLAIQTPRDGWVEQSGEALVTASLTVIASAVAHVGAENVAALAISNQRETAIGWYRDSGEPINAAITAMHPQRRVLRHAASRSSGTAH